MQNQACEPCAKRKVRCDRRDPCSNCKRRKQDRCVYSEPSPAERIKKLEQLVRALGADPDRDVGAYNSQQHGTASTGISPVPPLIIPPPTTQEPDSTISKKSKDPIIVDEDGDLYYLESRAWLAHGHRESGSRGATAKHPLLLQDAPPAFQTIICSRHSFDFNAVKTLQDNTQFLWALFTQRVNPFIMILFQWELERLQSYATLTPPSLPIDDAEQALIFSIYLAAVISLTDDESLSRIGKPKALLLADCQALCEEALARTNILSMKNITALKAMAIYLMVNMDRLSTQSIWTLMGLAIRNCEKLGLHRDGTLLGLSAVETVDRRRLWWQLQFLDLILAIRLGVTPLTLMADWDVKLPLNVEDDDLSQDMDRLPNERKGLTSMSYCLFTYYVLNEQRKYHANKGQFELSWSTNQSIPMPVKEAFINRLEDGLNEKFLQYCDPINPLHILLQLIARSLICMFRQRILLNCESDPGQVAQDHRTALLGWSMRLLEYDISLHSHHRLKDFRWFTANGFPWPAFMVVLVELSRETDIDKCQRVWALLTDLYTANDSLFELHQDRRRLHAAELLSSAWKAYQKKTTEYGSLSTPGFIVNLERRLLEYKVDSARNVNAPGINVNEVHSSILTGSTLKGSILEDNIDYSFDLEFQDIDWTFWNSID